MFYARNAGPTWNENNQAASFDNDNQHVKTAKQTTSSKTTNQNLAHPGSKDNI
jgi:hypothetical protein